MTNYLGAGTRNSPIAIDDSEDEVFNELYQASPQGSQTMSLTEDRRLASPPPPSAPFPTDGFDRLPDNRTLNQGNKRKRANSFTSQDNVASSSGNTQRPHPSLVNRLSQPESKKARKRRRKAERQALEEARLQNINWLNNSIPYASSFPSVIPPSMLPPPTFPASWNPMDVTYPGFHIPHEEPSYIEARGPTYMFPYETMPRKSPYEGNKRRSPAPSPSPSVFEHQPHSSTSSDWVYSMASAADHSFPQGNSSGELSWFPVSTQAPPPSAPSPPPSVVALTNNYSNPLANTPKPIEHHALPSKPAPPQLAMHIGMPPDPDPNSKHGTFNIASTTREAGSDVKKRTSQYIPNPARTLVIEQLPKQYRQPDFINNWSRTACGAIPVHIFIDGHGGKALIEFATAELARKAWASPRLGAAYAGLKSHQLKGKIRDDLIRLWWYRVDGIGAGAGVGEIEEGEIEGDISLEKEKEEEVVPKKETKKERKARLAKEREAKQQRELEARKAKQQQQQQQQSDFSNTSVQHVSSVGNGFVQTTQDLAAQMNQIYQQVTYSPFEATVPISTPTSVSFPLSWNPQQPSQPLQIPITINNNANSNATKTAYGASLWNDKGESESVASSTGRPDSPIPTPTTLPSTSAQADNLDDNEVVDMEVDEVSPTAVSQPVLPTPPPRHPMHSSLPARPTLGIVTQPAKPPPQKPPPVARILLSTRVPLSTKAKPFVPSAAMPPTNLSAPPTTIAAPHQKVPPPTAHPLTPPQPPPPISAAPEPSSAASSGSSSSASTPVPSEPKAMKNAPTEPSFTKRALLARQKELEEKIAKTKMELAAAAAGKGGPSTSAAAPTPASGPVHLDPAAMVQARPAMDLGEKQAMEARLRRLVLQSRKPVAQVQAQVSPADSGTQAPMAAVGPNASADPKPVMAASEPAPSASAPTPGFSLEDMAVSFITQTIATMKAQPATVAQAVAAPAPPPPPAVMKPAAQSHTDVKLELAEKQRRLEEHISESKSLMSQLAQARTKGEKDGIMRIMREKTRLFEEGSQAAAIKSQQTQTTTTTSAQQFRITRWPGNCQDAGVLMISDDEDEDEDED